MALKAMNLRLLKPSRTKEITQLFTSRISTGRSSKHMTERSSLPVISVLHTPRKNSSSHTSKASLLILPAFRTTFFHGATVVLLMLLAHWGFAQAHEVHVIPETQDYSTALELATEHNAFLLVSIEFHGKEKRDGVRNHLSKETTRTLFHKSMHKWVFCFLTMEDATTLITNPSLREMRQGPGVFVVDCTTGPLSGRIISILPKTPGKYYRFMPFHIDELANLPSGTLTQRSMILAVRIHPERPQSTASECHTYLCQKAASHSAYQANILKQGHHNWGPRSQDIVHKTGHIGQASEICAQSWENQDLLDSCVDCVASWRHSSGHWQAVHSKQIAYGYDIRRGTNGIWYATGIFLD